MDRVRLRVESLVKMVALFLLAGGCLAQIPSEVGMEAKSLARKDLPDDFPYQVFDAGFAVVKVKVENRGNTPLQVDPSLFQVFSPKGKRIEAAQPSEMPPKILKDYRSGGSGVHGGGHYGYPGNYPPGAPPGTVAQSRPSAIPSTGGARRLDAGTGTMLREKFESYHLKPVELEPGKEVEGFLYLRSKDSGNRLVGGEVRFEGLKAGL